MLMLIASTGTPLCSVYLYLSRKSEPDLKKKTVTKFDYINHWILPSNGALKHVQEECKHYLT